MTEEEAKMKWCPFVRIGNPANRSDAFVLDDTGFKATCIGSRCMAWYWSRVGKDSGYCGLTVKQ